MTDCYPSSIREEELKNKVAADFFGAFDCTRIVGNIDFCVAGKAAAKMVAPNMESRHLGGGGTMESRHLGGGLSAYASFYDIRLHFQGVKRTTSGKEQMNATSADETYNKLLATLRTAHKALAAQIAPKVYEYGFLKR